MQLNIRRSNNHKEKVGIKDVHGKYPYKLYLQLQGNSIYGKYIVIVSNVKLNTSSIDEVVIHVKDTISTKDEMSIRNQTQGLRPNSVNSNVAKYKVREASVLDVKGIPIYVFVPLKEKGIIGGAY